MKNPGGGTANGTALILGAVTHLPLHLFSPFVKSLRATAYQGRLYFLAGGYSDREVAELATLADEVLDVEPQYTSVKPAVVNGLRWLRRTPRVRRIYPASFGAALRLGSPARWDALEYHLEGLQSLRYGHYRRILEAAPEVDRVMITDVRDVVFQRDPFEDPVSGLELFLEDASVRIGHDHFNTRWLRDLYGDSTVEEMRSRVVSCSGTVVGTRSAMLQYLSEMVAGIEEHRRPMGSHDQAVHNALLHHGNLAFARVIANGHGRVLTMGAMKAFEASDEGVLLNTDGSVPAVIHQWDRHAPFVSQLQPFAYLSGH